MGNFKRIHLFEFEDFAWLPEWLRRCVTRLIVVMHRLVGTPQQLSELLDRALTHSSHNRVIDLCSGTGGPMLEVHRLLDQKNNSGAPQIVLTDLYPDSHLAASLNQTGRDSGISYLTTPVDARQVEPEQKGVRTLVSSFHHMRPDDARAILQDARANRQPILIYEISDNSPPVFLWWVSLPINFLMALFITPMVRPVTWQQLVFTYLIPVIPLCFAWDGAVSNARTYTHGDMDLLLQGLQADDYRWEKGTIKGTTNKLYLLGFPV